MRRVVKPPPRVTPQIQETSPSAPVVSSYEIPQKSESLYPSDDPEWEALVQQEMAKIQSEFEKMAQQERYDPPRKDYPSEQPRQTYQSPMRNSEGYPREMYEDQTSTSRAADYYPDLFDRPNHSLSPRRMKGGLNDLYGPDDDRQNMKAAKAAAYSHQLELQRNQQHNYRDVPGNGDYDLEPNRYRPQEALDFQQRAPAVDYQRRDPMRNAPEISPVKHDHYHSPKPHVREGGTGLAIGRSEFDEKALRRQRQAEYKRQLDAQSQAQQQQQRLQNEGDQLPINLKSRQAQAPQSNRHSDSSSHSPQDRERDQDRYRSYGNGNGDFGHHQEMNMPTRAAPAGAGAARGGYYQTPPQEDYHIPPMSDYPPRQMMDQQPAIARRNPNPNPPPGPVSEFDQQQPVHRSHLKGVVGKVNVESQDVDKNQKRRQQEEYRRQLEIQAKADQDRKEKEKNQWESDLSKQKNREKEKEEEAEAAAGRQNRDRDSYSRQPPAPPLGYDDDSYDSDSRDRSRYDRPHKDHLGRETTAAPAVSVTNNSPAKSPTKARNRMMNDVYGGFSLGNLASEDPIGKISMRGLDSNDNKKKAAIREQQLALEQQIAEKKRLKELEKEKIRLEEQKALEYEAEQERKLAGPKGSPPPPATELSERELEQQQEQGQGSVLEKAAQSAARERMRLHKAATAAAAAGGGLGGQRKPPPSPKIDESYEHELQQQRYGEQESASPRSPALQKVPRPPPPTYLLEDLGLSAEREPSGYQPSGYQSYEQSHSKPKVTHFASESRRLATPGGSLEQDSQIVPLPSSQSQNQRDSYREDRYRQYRKGNVDEEDRVVVDWQHHRGYSTKRGTTPTATATATSASSASAGGLKKNQKAHADPWAPDGLLTLLTKPKDRPSEKSKQQQELIDESSIIEKSLVSDSLLMFLDRDLPPPSRGGNHGKRSSQRAPPLEVQPPLRELDSMNSPLSSFVNSHSQRHGSGPVASPSKVRSPHRSVIPVKYDPRLSDDQLERLISQSKAHLVTNLLLQDNDSSASYALAPPAVLVDSSRPLTSAGRKLTSRGSLTHSLPSLTPPSAHPTDSYHSRSGPIERADSSDHEDEILIVPTSRSSSRSLGLKHKGATYQAEGDDEEEDVVLNPTASLQVQTISETDKKLMMQMMEDEFRSPPRAASRPSSKQSSGLGLSSRQEPSSRPSSQRSDLDRVGSAKAASRPSSSSRSSRYSPPPQEKERERTPKDKHVSRPTSGASVRSTGTGIGTPRQQERGELSANESFTPLSSSRPASRPSRSSHSHSSTGDSGETEMAIPLSGRATSQRSEASASPRRQQQGDVATISQSRPSSRHSTSHSQRASRPSSGRPQSRESQKSERRGEESAAEWIQDSASRPTSHHSSRLPSREASSSRQSSRSKWDVSESSRERAISSLRNQQPSVSVSAGYGNGYDHSQAHDDHGTLGDDASASALSDGDYQSEEYPGHHELGDGNGYDAQQGEGAGEGEGEGSYYNYDEGEAGEAAGSHYDSYFYGNQYGNDNEQGYEEEGQEPAGGGQYYDQEGNLIDPSRISSEQFSDRNEMTLQSSDYLRNLAMEN